MPSKYGFGDERKKNAPTYMKSGYAPFKMKAAGFGNSPMLKNFGVGGSPAKLWGSSPRGVALPAQTSAVQEHEDAVQQTMMQASQASLQSKKEGA